MTDILSSWSDFFSYHAPEYDENCFTKNTGAEVEFLIEELEILPGMSILDVGCGTGRHSIALAKKGYRVTGIDLTEAMLKEAKKKADEAGVEVTWIQSDAKSFQLDEQFDAVICLCEGAFGLLSSADDPIQQPLAILKNTANAMKPGAGCLFTVLNACKMIRQYSQEDVEKNVFDPLSMSEISEVEMPGGKKHNLRERGFVPTELRLMFNLAGIEVKNFWGGTAGNWGRRKIELDEFEIMVRGIKVC